MNTGWELKTLDCIAEVKGGKRVPKGYQLQSEPTNHPYITVSDFSDDGTVDSSGLRYVNSEVFEQIKRYTISSKDLYLSIAGTIGKTGRVPPELDGACLTENACKLVMRPNIDRDFVYYFTQSDDFARQAGTNTRTAAQPKLALERLKTIQLRIPTSVPEQRRIVAILDEAFKGIATAKANAEKILQSASELLEVATREAFDKLGKQHQTRLLGSVCRFENGDRGKNYPGKEHRVRQGIPFINAGHLTPEGIDFTAMDYISPERFDLLGNGKIQPMDVLFCLRGSLGKYASVGDVSGGAIASSLVILRPSKELDHEYLLCFLGSTLCTEQIETYKGGAAQPNLGAKDLKQFVMPLPPIDAQRLVAQHIMEWQVRISDLSKVTTKKLSALEDLKKSILHDAFSGAL